MSELKYFAAVLIVAVVALTVMAVAYWYIMKQDATALTTISAAIGGLVGYFFKLLKDKMSKQE
ncbi:MAG: hypothetical protein QW794_01765 [Thermosphaera sp.]